MIWELLFSSLFAAAAYKVIRVLNSRQRLQKKNISLPGHLRDLGLLEFIFHTLFQMNDYLLSYEVVIKSKVSMENRKVEEALEILAKRHPLLQAAITEVNHADDNHYHFTKMPFFRIDYQHCNKLATEPSHRHDVITKDLLAPLNDRDGPLWRCCRLKECIDSESSFTNCFVFTFHHAIIDGASKTMLFVEFLSILDKLHKNEAVPEISYVIRPSCETLLCDRIHPEWWLRIGIKILEFIFKMGLYSLKSKKIDVYFNKYPVIQNLDPDVQQENGVICSSFSKLETKKLLKACKEHGCTVNGAITAAANIAMADILQNEERTKAQWIPSSYAISCRRHIDLKETQNICYLGFNSCIANLNCHVPPHDSKSFSLVFWEAAKDITDDVHKTIKTEAHFRDTKIRQAISLSLFRSLIRSTVWEHHGGRDGNSLFYISNAGRYDDSSNVDSLFSIDELFVAVAVHRRGFLFEIFFVTINGKFCCSLVYAPHVTAKSQAEEFSSKLLQNLRCTFKES